MTNGTKYSVTVPRFASNLGLTTHTKYPKKLHDERVLGLNEATSRYETTDFQALSITNFKPELIVFHRVVQKSLAPREGDSSRVP
jgi:hypothetical protein